MTIHIYQVIVVSVSVFMIFQGVKNFIKGKSGQTFLKLLVRIIVWGGMMFIAIFPSFTNVLATAVGLKGNINAVILTGFLLIFLMIFKLLSAIERLEQGLSEVTRKEALKEIKKD
jgi:hypothetical protein